jgi:hypothetical protein
LASAVRVVHPVRVGAVEHVAEAQLRRRREAEGGVRDLHRAAVCEPPVCRRVDLLAVDGDGFQARRRCTVRFAQLPRVDDRHTLAVGDPDPPGLVAHGSGAVLPHLRARLQSIALVVKRVSETVVGLLLDLVHLARMEAHQRGSRVHPDPHISLRILDQHRDDARDRRMRRRDGREATVLVAAHAARRGEPHVFVVALNDLPHQAR